MGYSGAWNGNLEVSILEVEVVDRDTPIAQLFPGDLMKVGRLAVTPLFVKIVR